MTLRFLVSSIALAGAVLSPAAWAQQQLVPAQSSVGFTIKQMGVPLQGQFKQFSAQVQFDTTKPEASKIQFTVATGSATMGSKETDAEMPKAPWFNVASFPQATFASTAVKALGAGKYQVQGKLSIKGQSQDVSLPVTLTQNGATTIAAGTLPIKRLAFKIGEGDWSDTSMVADDVQVTFKLALAGVGKI